MVDIDSLAGASPIDPWSPPLDGDDDERRRAATAGRAVVRDASELPELPDANTALLARASAQATTPAPRPLLATGLSSTDVARVDSTSTSMPPVQRRLDAFLAAAKPTYHVPGVGDVAVATPFRMVGPLHPTEAQRQDPVTMNYALQELAVKSTRPDLEAIAREHGISPGQLDVIQQGRGTPEQIRTLTQALIDKGRLPAPGRFPTSEARVRTMMFYYGLGLDCAGYVQQAVLAGHGITRAQAGFQPSPLNEGLFDPAASGRFRRVAPEDAQAGDVIALGPPEGQTFGHRVVVSRRHELQPADLKDYRATGADLAKLNSGHVVMLDVDSSWGSGGTPQAGGVERHTWLYDSTSGSWAEVSREKAVHFTDLPYHGHPVVGVFHYAGAR